MKISGLRAFTACIILLVVAGLTGCASKPILFPTKIKAELVADEGLNPDINGRPSPLVVRLYQLKSIDTFENADFFTLYDEEASALGGDLVTREEFEMTPGEVRSYEHRPDDSANYFAVIAAYRDIDEAHWRTITEIKKNKTNKLIVQLGPHAVNFKER